MVKAINHAFESLQTTRTKFVWITLQACKVEVIKTVGGIDYHIPHMNKTKLAREGRLLKYLSVKREIIYDSLRYVDTKVEKSMFDIILFYLGINDQQIFHQAGEGTSRTNDESRKRTTTTIIDDEPAPPNTLQEQDQSPTTNEVAEETEIM